MADDTLYITTYEAALAVVATAMKKARLLLDTLVVNLFMGGVLFATGGMLSVIVVNNNPETLANNPGFINMFEGLMYPIGLFYVVIMGVDLYNSNVLFFAVGLARGAVSILDLVISWLVSYWFNMVGNIFVCYLFCYYANVDQNVASSRRVLEAKTASTFTETLLKGMAGNFFVCLAIYLQLMAKPLHVKLLMLILPVFTFVSIGFSHSVADMFVGIYGLINHADVSVGTVAWKLFLPGFLGNTIGGSFFALVVPWYLHLFVVERDRRKLNLPAFDMRDEQPELNQDSRVVRVSHKEEAEAEEDEEEHEKEYGREEEHTDSDNCKLLDRRTASLDSSRLGSIPSASLNPVQTTRSFSSKKSMHRSPANVFPVYGMGVPAERERSIASGTRSEDSFKDAQSFEDPEEYRPGAEYLGNQLKRSLTRPKKLTDLEHSPYQKTGRSHSFRSVNIPAQMRKFSFGSMRNQNNVNELNRRYTQAGILRKAENAANEAAGASSVLDHVPRPAAVKRKSTNTVDPRYSPYEQPESNDSTYFPSESGR